MKKITIAFLFVALASVAPVLAEPCTVGLPCPFGLQQVTVSITAAEILDSFDNPVELVPAPGAGFVVVPLRVIKFAGAGAAYNTTAEVRSADGSDVAAAVSFGEAFDSYTVPNIGGALAEFENRALVLLGGSTIDDNAGAIATSSLGTGGADYEVGDIGSIDTGNADAIYEVDTVDGGGAVTAFTVTEAGSGYAVAAGVATTAIDGMGTGLEIDIDSITLGSRPVSITVVYSVISTP